MTTNYGGMTPWQYNDYARSLERQGTGTNPLGGSSSYSNSLSLLRPPSSQQDSTAPTTDPYKDIDRSPFELGENDALTLARQQRIRDATDYRYNLAGLPQPIDVWSGNVADTQRNMGLGLRPSLMPGTGSFADSESLRAWQLAREAYMSDPIRAAMEALSGGSGGGSNPGPYPVQPPDGIMPTQTTDTGAPRTWGNTAYNTGPWSQQSTYPHRTTL